jgi:uncharacterized protein (TIGR04255 family)
MARHRFKRPPVVEAICQIRLLPTQELHLRQLARLHERLIARYPGRPTERQGVQSELTGGTSAEGNAEIQSKYTLARQTLLPTADGTRFIAVSANEFSVHTLPPYDGWDAFRERIVEVLGVYAEAEIPRLAYRVAVRYTNRISLQVNSAPLETYFTRAPGYPAGLPVLGLNSFFSRIECEYPDEPMRLTLVLTDVQPSPVELPAFLLDVEAAWMNKEEPLVVTEVLAKIEDLKERVSVAFEKSLTDEARRLFDVD